MWIPVAAILIAPFIIWIAHRSEQAKMQAQRDVQLALLAKFSSGEEMTRFLATDEGRRLMDHLASSGKKDPRHETAGMLVGASILTMLGIGFGVAATVTGEESLLNSSAGHWSGWYRPDCGSGHRTPFLDEKRADPGTALRHSNPGMPRLAAVAPHPAMQEDEAQTLTQRGFEDLYANLGPRLLSFLTRQVRNPDLASDLLQDTFLRVLRSPIRVFSDGELRGYAYRSAHSVVTDHFRREQRARSWSLLSGRNAPVPPRPASGMDRVFAELKPRERSLLWMAYVEEMNHEEIAAALGVRPSSVKVLLHRARKRLGDKLKKQNLGPEARDD